MRLDEIAGSVETDASAAVALLRTWFKPDDLVTLVGIREKRPRRPHLLAQTETAGAWVEWFSASPKNIRALVLSDDSQWNLYFLVNPVKEHVENVFKRGGDSNVSSFRGVWVDLDVKPGAFTDEEHAVQFLRGLEILPSVVVLTGSGGVHAYWKLDQDLSPRDGRRLTRAWWSHLADRAEEYGAKVDRLVDIARMMRVPGTIRWPRPDEQVTAHQVKLLYAGKETVTAEDLRRVSAAAEQRRATRVKDTVDRDRQRDEVRKLRESALKDLGDWQKLQVIASVDDVFNGVVTWDEILESVGWTYLRTDSQDRREWSRPGRGEKSATTDWPESPDVMSLLSSSEDTGLFDLKEAEIPLTKYRVALRLWFKDDDDAMIDWVLERLQSRGVQ